MIPSCIFIIEDESDREYMTQLYIQYQRLMYHTIYKIVKDPWKVEDILQMTLEKLIEKLSLLKTMERNRLVNYIISACKNNAINELNRSSRHPVFSFEDCCDVPYSDDGASIEEWLIKKDAVRQLRQVWPKLDMRSQYLLEARYILNLSTEEIARELKIKPDSIRMTLSRARKKAVYLLKTLEKGQLR